MVGLVEKKFEKEWSPFRAAVWKNDEIITFWMDGGVGEDGIRFLQFKVIIF